MDNQQTSHDEYCLRQAPAGYERRRTAAFVAVGIGVFSAALWLALAVQRAAWSGCGAGVGLVFFAAVLTLLWAIAGLRKYPQGQRYHEKALPPLVDPDRLKTELRISLASQPAGCVLTVTALLLLGALLVATALFLAPPGSAIITWIAILLALLAAAALAFSWRATYRTARAAQQHPVLVANSSGLFIPAHLVVQPLAVQPLDEAGALQLPWTDIAGWVVASGSDSAPDVYQINCRKLGTLEINRQPLRGSERLLLHYARAAGIAILLKTSILEGNLQHN